MWVVKIGGSLASSPDLRAWLAALAGPGKFPAVVVPGGGPFADLVRREQATQGFDDIQAHRMAVLAMERYGLMLCGLQPRLVPAASVAHILAAQARGEIPVWMAGSMAFAASDIAASWDVTSDSLAAWLAKTIGAKALFLVKSAPAPAGRAARSAASLARSGLVDAAFPRAVSANGFALRWLGPGDWVAFADARRRGVLCGAAIGRGASPLGVDNAQGHG